MRLSESGMKDAVCIGLPKDPSHLEAHVSYKTAPVRC